jgi:hypothetical protein
LKHLMPLMDDDISKHLQTIKSALEEGKDDLLVKTDIINAWVRCHEQRIGLVYRRSTEQLLTPPSGLCHLELSSCSVTDGALAYLPTWPHFTEKNSFKSDYEFSRTSVRRDLSAFDKSLGLVCPLLLVFQIIRWFASCYVCFRCSYILLPFYGVCDWSRLYAHVP